MQRQCRRWHVKLSWPCGEGRGGAANEGGGVTGPKSLGVRELTYRLSFLASSVQVSNPYLLSLLTMLYYPPAFLLNSSLSSCQIISQLLLGLASAYLLRAMADLSHAVEQQNHIPGRL